MTIERERVEKDSPIERLRRWQRGETPGPWNVIFYPTDRCNLKCVMCWRNRFDYVGGEEDMPDDRLRALVDECAELGCREWTIIGGGEPLLRAPLVLEMCEGIRRHGMWGTLQCNGTLLKPDYMKKLIEIEWNEVVCSLDGPTEEINDGIRGPNTFKRATEAMARFSALRREMEVQHPRLCLYTTVTRHNHDVLPAMVELTHRLGCDGYRAGHCMGDWCQEHLVTPEQQAALPEIVERARERGRALGVFTDLDPLLKFSSTVHKRDKLIDRFLGKGRGISGAYCPDPWHSVAILGDGRVGPCCSGWLERAPRILDGSLKEIWLGPYFTELRREIMENRPLEFCRICPPLLMKRAESTRRIMRFMDAVENWSDLRWGQKLFVNAWEAHAQYHEKGLIGSLKTLFTLRRGK